MLKRLIALILVNLTLWSSSSVAGDAPWFFNAGAMANAHRYQRQFGARLHNPLQPTDCYYGQDDFMVIYRDKTLLVPCRFVTATTRQLKQLLLSGAARYLFPLDLGEVGLAVPTGVYASKYKSLPIDEILPHVLREPKLVALYKTQTQANRSREPRVIIVSFYDGRPNQSLPQAQILEGFVEVSTLYLLEHFLGELGTIIEQRVVTFDMSFENDNAAAPAIRDRPARR